MSPFTLMPINGCTSGLAVTALMTLLLLPTSYFVPELHQDNGPAASSRRDTLVSPAWLDLALDNISPFDLALTALLLIIGVIIYLWKWIQRKILEHRIIKLSQYLSASVDRLRAWDVRQEQLEATLKMVQDATAEYELLLYLVLRHNQCLAPVHDGHPSKSYFDKELLDEDIAFLGDISARVNN